MNYSYSKQQILDSSKLKEFADNNFRFDENGRKFFIWVENAAGKGEIARFERFPLFPSSFHKICTPDMLKTRAVIKCDLTLSQTTNFRPFQSERVCRRQF